MPDAAWSCCCLQKVKLPAVVSADLLQLAVNCSWSRVAEAAAKRMPAQLQPGAVYKLLLTAAKREHFLTFKCIASAAAAQHHLDLEH
jgi:hypothetical protein